MGMPKFGAVDEIKPKVQANKPAKKLGMPTFGAIDEIPEKQKVLTSANRPKTPKIPSQNRRRPLEHETIYGDELFVSAMKKAREIVVCFMPFTKNNMRISTDGKYVMQYSILSPDEDGNTEFFSLYYFKETPIQSFVMEKASRSIIFLCEHQKVIDNSIHLEELKLKIISCEKEEQAELKKAKMDDIVAKEYEEKLEKDKKEQIADELEEMQETAVNFSLKMPKEKENELVTSSSTEFSTNSDSKINDETTKEQEGTEIQIEESKINDSEANKNKETGKSGIWAFKQTE